MKMKVLKIKTDEEAEAFLSQDLSNLDFSQFKKVNFQFEADNGRINLRLPRSLLSAVKAKALDEGIPYQSFIRNALEHAIMAAKKTAQ